MFNFPNNTKLFSKVVLLIYIFLYECFGCTNSSLILEIVKHCHFCQSKVENGPIEHNTESVTSTWQRSGTPTTWKIAKIIIMPATRNRSRNTSAHCILVSKSPKKIKHNLALDGMLLLI